MQNSWEKLSDPSFLEGSLDFSLPSSPLSAKFLRGPANSATLIVWFHPAYDRPQNDVPYFYGPDHSLSHAAHQLSVADPTLIHHKNLRLAWYIGDESFNAQKELADLFSQIQRNLSIARLIFVGASSGGFAALYFAMTQPNACAVAIQPQTNLTLYSDRYLASCWPNKSLSDIENLACIDLCKAYHAGFKNTVIYIQSIGDRMHMRYHLAPFQYATRRHQADGIIYHVDFWGSLGHTAVPRGIVKSWIKAAIFAETIKIEHILRRRHATQSRKAAPIELVRQDQAFSPSDIALARLLRDRSLT